MCTDREEELSYLSHNFLYLNGLTDFSALKSLDLMLGRLANTYILLINAYLLINSLRGECV